MPLTSVSLSTSAIPGPSSPVALNWRGGRPVTWQITANSCVATGDFQLQFTCNDLQIMTNSSIYPITGSPTLITSTMVVWTSISSAPAQAVNLLAGFHFASSAVWPDGITGSFLASPGALRLYSSAGSSGILTLQVIQGDGG